MSDPAADRAPDLVDRQFRVAAPNRLFVADFTYVKLITGVVRVRRVRDRRVRRADHRLGMPRPRRSTQFVESARRQAVALRARQGHRVDQAIHYSDAGSQYTAVHFAETLVLRRSSPPRSAPSETRTTTPWQKPRSGSTRPNVSEPTHHSGEARCATLADVELITAEWAAWFNEHRLMHRLDRIPPAEAETAYHANNPTAEPVESQPPEGA